jgi:hypothetical protein
MKAMRILLVGLAVAGVAFIGAASPAQAAGPERITAYDIRVAIAPDSSLRVTERIDYDFGSQQRRGIFRVIPIADRYDETYDRVIEIDDVRVGSPTGAPTQVQIETKDGVEYIRIGDPDVTISGSQTYLIDYVVRGVMNAFPEADELVWNAVGLDWDVPIESVRTIVTAPVAPTRARCTTGPGGSQQPCTAVAVVGDEGRFRQASLAPNEGLTVSVALPPGSVAVGEPILQARWSLARAFSVTPLTGSVALLVLLIGAGAVLWIAWRQGRDRRFVGEVPGLEPPAGMAGVEEPRPLGTGPEGAVEFQPPPDVRPGLVGTLIDEQANVLDVTATVIDLAVRGYLRIEEIPKEGWFGSADWRIVPLKPADDGLLAFETRLLTAMTGRTDNRLSVVARDAALDLQLVQADLYNEVVSRRWFRGRPDEVRRVWYFLGGLLTALGVGLTFVLARWTTFGLAGLAAIVSGLVLVVAAPRMPARTGRGSATLARTLGFRAYIRTAEVEQIRFEEREQVFSRYLPYAMVFGETERWAKAFTAVGFGAAAGAAAGASLGGGLPYLPWYAMASGSSMDDFSAAMNGFTVTTAGSISAAAAAASAASGGSAFSGGGGFSGGGFGGGGGGSW